MSETNLPEIKDRVVAFERVPASDLEDNTGNWRKHEKAQRGALRGLLQEVGIAGALVAYHSDRNDGKLTLIDGHMRKDEYAGDWPVLVLDITDQEADKLLAFYDPIAAMAGVLPDKLRDLSGSVHTNNPHLQSIIDRQQAEADLADLMAQVSEEFEELAGGTGDKSHSDLTSQRAKVRPVIWIEDLDTFERAIRAVGNPNRGESIIAICQFYLDNAGTEGSNAEG